jgi:hypothetical protein
VGGRVRALLTIRRRSALDDRLASEIRCVEAHHVVVIQIIDLTLRATMNAGMDTGAHFLDWPGLMGSARVN